jgi:hypothetical protein
LESNHQVFVMSTGTSATSASLPLQNVSIVFDPKKTVCLRDLYSGKPLTPLPAGMPLTAALPVHDSRMFCAFSSSADGTCDGKDCP